MKEAQSFFGTDGIRGCVGETPITVDCILKLGWAIGHVLAEEKEATVLIGKDTRISGYMIESALEAGLSAAGIHIYLLGPIPTSAIAYLTRTFRASMGIVISASHNPFEDNGIKFFSGDGFKISPDLESRIEAAFFKPMTTKNSLSLGKAWRIDDAVGRYIEFCKSCVPHNTNLRGLKIVIDCANGATYHIAPFVFRELGAEVVVIHANPNGLNINDQCGSTHPEVIREKVLEEKADLGIAFDGDGDRALLVDHRGEILDGDELLFIIANELHHAKSLAGGIVGTTMSNHGLELAIQEMGLDFYRTSVGDQYVIQSLRQKRWVLGGEPSGHIIYLPVTTAADGIITALQTLQAIQHTGLSLYELKNKLVKFPQCIRNIPHQGHKNLLERKELIEMIKKIENKLGKRGRTLVRYSGTEPLIRVMVEGEDETLVKDLSATIADTIQQLILKK